MTRYEVCRLTGCEVFDTVDAAIARVKELRAADDTVMDVIYEIDADDNCTGLTFVDACND